MLTNNCGGYLWLSQEPLSRYQGWFFAPEHLVGKKLFKIVEDIELPHISQPTLLKNNFWNIERQRGRIKESFFLPRFFNALVYEISKPFDIEIFLDIKESYDNSGYGRFYEIFREKDKIIAHYTQEGLGLKEVFIAFKSQNNQVCPIKEWVLRDYPLDKERNSPPFERYVFKALRFQGETKVVLSVAETKERAVREVEYVFKNLPRLKKASQEELKRGWPKILCKDKSVVLAGLCAALSLKSLLCYADKGKKVLGLYAGLPWFFQFWGRDEGFCLKALKKLEPRAAEEIITARLKTLSRKAMGFNLTDQEAWYLKRAEGFAVARPSAKAVLKKILLSKAEPFALAAQTWMDSIKRQQAPLELQCFKLGFCSQEQEKTLKKIVQEKFWNGNFLADGFNLSSNAADFTLRPNIFLAAYLYPTLLTKAQWTQCFQGTLKGLWLKWGGLATIDKTSPFFYTQHTGEVSLSYHQGDSWFFINNLAALALYQTDPHKFKNYIKQITKASAQEILWQGIIGHHAELSSAGSFQSQGCLCQAWSSAAFLELIARSLQGVKLLAKGLDKQSNLCVK